MRLSTAWKALISWKMPTSPRRSGAASDGLHPVRFANENAFLLQLAHLQLRRGFLEFFVFDQLPDQIPARIVFLRVFLRRLLIDGQQAAAFQINQVRGHDHEFARDIDVQLLEGLQILQVLPRDALERDLVDIELVLLDQIEQEIERTLEDLELNLVFALHGAGPIFGEPPAGRQRGPGSLNGDGLTMDPDAIHDPEPEHDHEHKRTAIADERQRHAGDGEHRDRHADILENVGENERGKPDDEEQPEMVARAKGARRGTSAEAARTPQQKRPADETPLLADGGKDVVIMHRRGREEPSSICVSVALKPLPDQPPEPIAMSD